MRTSHTMDCFLRSLLTTHDVLDSSMTSSGVGSLCLNREQFKRHRPDTKERKKDFIYILGVACRLAIVRYPFGRRSDRPSPKADTPNTSNSSPEPSPCRCPINWFDDLNML